VLKASDQIKLRISYESMPKVPRPDPEAIADISRPRRGQKSVLTQVPSFSFFLAGHTKQPKAGGESS
jgi:hypothetical protein